MFSCDLFRQGKGNVECARVLMLIFFEVLDGEWRVDKTQTFSIANIIILKMERSPWFILDPHSTQLFCVSLQPLSPESTAPPRSNSKSLLQDQVPPEKSFVKLENLLLDPLRLGCGFVMANATKTKGWHRSAFTGRRRSHDQQAQFHLQTTTIVMAALAVDNQPPQRQRKEQHREIEPPDFQPNWTIYTDSHDLPLLFHFSSPITYRSPYSLYPNLYE